MSTFKAGGKTYNIADYGSKLGSGELKELAQRSGLTEASILDKFKAAGGTLSSAAKAYYTPATTTTTPTNTTTNQAGGTTDWREQLNAQTDAQSTLYQNLYDFQQGLARTQNEGTINSTTIRAEADKEIARIDADARRYLGELGLQGTKYASDKESEWRQAVSNIEVKGKLDLQPIINAGLERVAEIEGQSARDVAETTGSYGLKSMEARTSADKELGKMQLAGGMYGLLSSVFG